MVGVDGSETAEVAACWAAAEAHRRGVPLVLLHACGLPPMTPRARAALPPGYEEALHEFGQAWLRDAEAAAGLEGASVPVEREVRPGAPRDVLTEASEHAGLLVLGSRGLGALRRLALGSVAVAVAAHARCPVVVVPSADALTADGPVVVGVGESPVSDETLAFAFEAAAARNVPLLAVRSWLEDSAYDAWRGLPSREETDEAAAAQEKFLRRGLEGWREKYPQVQVRELSMRASRPAEALLAVAAQAQLIVVGTHGRGRVGGVLLGSTSQAVMHGARCAVAVVAPDASVT
ncbi:hypothetical protein BA062_14170 [Prauserella flavalba]|uniref:UspA domain-containing protein n=1 Tax=Prauserella flavalba TaxID=1477506 RepID=A0A318LXJ8_9PSEU|nr:hypothetical protein BA062_14170 [Prauserella flavalba]